MITFVCDSCGKSMRVRDDLLAKRIKCPGCGEATRVAPTAPGRPRSKPDKGEKSGRRDKVATGPSGLLLVIGLVLGLGGLVSTAYFIYQAKQANDVVADLEFQKTSDEANIAEARGRVSRSYAWAGVCGALFLIGVGLRGYHFFAKPEPKTESRRHRSSPS